MNFEEKYLMPTHIAHIGKAPRANASTKALSKSLQSQQKKTYKKLPDPLKKTLTHEPTENKKITWKGNHNGLQERQEWCVDRNTRR